jgi:MFS family permease
MAEGSQLSVALFGIIGGFSFGYNTGVFVISIQLNSSCLYVGIISTARPIIANEFGATSNLMAGLLTSTILVGAMIGSFGGGVIASKFGRRLSNSVGSSFQFLGILAAGIC